MNHVDDWPQTAFMSGDEGKRYAAAVLTLDRMPAYMQFVYEENGMRPRLFCTYEGKRWQVTGASRMGDVWLAEDFLRNTGYDKRVDVTQCSEWGKTP